MIHYLAIAVATAICYGALGLTVSHAPPAGIDVAGRALVGGPPRLALLFTESCYWYVLLALGAIAILIAVRVPAWRGRVTYSVVTTVVTWQVSDVLKTVFRRPRPEYWRIIHEPTYAYSSGHAMFAVLVYGLWAWFVWRSDLPRPVRLIVPPLLVFWAIGILWSRLALGAHYVTDLIGGILLAVTALSLASAISGLVVAVRARSIAPRRA